MNMCPSTEGVNSMSVSAGDDGVHAVNVGHKLESVCRVAWRREPRNVCVPEYNTRHVPFTRR